MVTIGIVALALGLFAWVSLNYKSYMFGRMIWRVQTDEKIIALTFDDGPNDPYTAQIAEILESYNGKATFFVVGKNCERFPLTAKAMQDRGHQIGAHSYRHEFSRYILDPFYHGEINRTQDILKNQGVKAGLYRFPWLFRTPWLLASVKKAGYTMPISGQFSHAFEPFQIDARRIARHTLRIAKPGSIIIFHDGYNAKAAPREQTVEAVRQVAKELAKQGYSFVTVSDLLARENR